jgi:hypothetical protein
MAMDANLTGRKIQEFFSSVSEGTYFNMLLSFSSKAGPRKPLAMILPSPSSK